MTRTLRQNRTTPRRTINATRAVVSTFGVIAALAGIEHGIGEILQGNIAPGGIVFLSWPHSPFFENLGGEPAMTLIPNLLVSGILASFFSLVFLLWATLFAERKNSGLILMLLSVVMLLVGGGFGPPLLGLILSATATRIHAPLTWWRTRLSVGLRNFLSKVWLWSFVAAVTAWLLLLPGSSLLAYYLGVNNANLVLTLILCAFGFLALTIFTGFAHDAERKTDLPRASPVNRVAKLRGLEVDILFALATSFESEKRLHTM